MPRQALTDRFLAGLRVRERTNYFDTKERGLVLRVTPRGARTWYFAYRVNGNAPRWLPLGSADDLTLAEARAQVIHHRRTVKVEKIDPLQVAREADVQAQREAEAQVEREVRAQAEAKAAAYTFAKLAELYATFAKGRKKTWRADVTKIERYLVPAWGHLPLREITRRHVHELLDTLVAQGMTIGVNRIQALISRLFTLALDRSLIDAHPSSRMIKRFKEEARERVLTDDELRALWLGLEAHPGAAADVVRLRLLLGQRGGEIADLQWAELDEAANVWVIPGARTKNKQRHAVPLPSTAVALLARRRAARTGDEPRVFPGFTLSDDAYRALATLHGGAYEWTDLRRTVATRLAALGFNETTIGRVLNHAKYTVTAKHYNQHAYLDEKRQALDTWERALLGIVTGAAPAVKVLRHRPRRERR